MKKNKIVVLLAVIVLVLASLACNAVTGGTIGISNAHLASDEADTKQVDGYVPSAAGFYCYFDLNNAPDSTVVKGVWTLVAADGYDSNSEIDSAEITGGDNTYYFSLARSADEWPVGKYKIDLYIDGSLVQTIDFEVQ